MSEISHFLGIIIHMFVREHPPHFHAFYQDYGASIEIESGAVTGNLPPRAVGFVQEWRALHQAELLKIWQDAVETGKFSKIEPLE